MNKFVIKPKLVFNNNSTGYIKSMAEKSFFIITDPFMVSSGMVNKVTDEIGQRDYEIFSDIVPDPPLETVAKGIKKLKDFSPECVIALGGGSAIDTAKAIIFYSNEKNIKFVAIPTTSGTGSEVTSFSVITDKAKGIKYPIVSDEMLPDIAILDTSFVMSVPPQIVADTGIDVLTHAIEAYVSVSANDFSDTFAEKAIRLVHKYLIRSYKDPKDFEAKDKMHKASLMAGIAFNCASLGLNHAIAHNIGGKLHVPHGRTNAMLLTKVIEFNSSITGYNSTDYSECAKRYADIANIMGISGSNTKVLVRGLIKEINNLISKLNIPTSFSQQNIKCTPEIIEQIAMGALEDRCITTNPQKVSKQDIINIIKKLE